MNEIVHLHSNSHIFFCTLMLFFFNVFLLYYIWITVHTQTQEKHIILIQLFNLVIAYIRTLYIHS